MKRIREYRWEGKWPKSQPSTPTPNGGDGYLNKNKLKNKLSADKGVAQREATAQGMRHLVILPSGRRVWRGVDKVF